MSEQNHESGHKYAPFNCSIPDDVRLWIAKARNRLERHHRQPITINDAHALLRESIDIAQRFNCYESNTEGHGRAIARPLERLVVPDTEPNKEIDRK